VKEELDEAIEEMQNILDKEVEPEGDAGCDAESSQKNLSYADVIKDPAMPFLEPLTCPIFDDFTPSNISEHVIAIPIYRAQIIPASYYDPPSIDSPSYTHPSFASLWKKGLPLLVKGVLPRFKLDWSPEYFVNKYGDQSCLIVECQTDTNKKVSVKEFFDWFGKYEGRKECWKLKVGVVDCSGDSSHLASSGGRIGPQRQNLRALSRSFTRTSVLLFPCQTTCDVMGYSILVHTFLSMLWGQT